MDFAAALANHGNDGTGHDQHDTSHMQVQGDGQSVSDTAAAAMAQYHTMTVPQSTEQSFMTQGGDGDLKGNGSMDQSGGSGQQRTSSFSDFDVAVTQGSPNGDASPGGRLDRLGQPKPAVGSDEWHKVRKDNHKEGRLKL